MPQRSTTDPFPDFDRLAFQRLLDETNTGSAVMLRAGRLARRGRPPAEQPSSSTRWPPAWESIDLDVERNVLTVRAERVARTRRSVAGAGQRAHPGAFSRLLGWRQPDILERIDASLPRRRRGRDRAIPEPPRRPCRSKIEETSPRRDLRRDRGLIDTGRSPQGRWAPPGRPCRTFLGRPSIAPPGDGVTGDRHAIASPHDIKLWRRL